MGDETKTGQMKTVANEIKSRLSNHFAQDEYTNLRNKIKEKDYKFLIDYLYEKRSLDVSHREEIESIFEKEEYLIPDLSESIDYNIWSYCHEIARFIANDKNHVEKFIKVLVKQYELNPTSVTLKLKCSGLMMQYFNKRFEDCININRKNE